MDYQYYLKREQTTDNGQRTTDNEQLTTDNYIQKYVFVACKVVKYQIVTFYENRLKGEQYAKNPGRHLP